MDPSRGTPVRALTLREPLFLRPETRLLDALAAFRQARCHISMVHCYTLMIAS